MNVDVFMDKLLKNVNFGLIIKNLCSFKKYEMKSFFCKFYQSLKQNITRMLKVWNIFTPDYNGKPLSCKSKKIWLGS